MLNNASLMPRHTSADHFADGMGLIPNLVRFVNLLRYHGISVSMTSVLDAVRGMHLIDISRVQNFCDLLCCNFIHHREDLPKFERLFCLFWMQTAMQNRKADTPQPAADAAPQPAQYAESKSQAAKGHKKGNTPATAVTSPMTYSSQTVSPKPASDRFDLQDTAADNRAIIKLLQKLTRRIGRRYRFVVHGNEIALRKMLRRNLQFGGELLLLDFKRKKIKRRPVTFLCDVSGSMDLFTLLIFQFMHVLQRLFAGTEVFFFSTSLSRATPIFQLRDFQETLSRLPQKISHWGGGTRIGNCLRVFIDRYGRYWRNGRNVVVIFSDGWDQGEIDLLKHQMALLKQKAHKIIWLNPLLGTRDYQPICRGMEAALPFVDYFLPAARVRDLTLIAKTLITS